MTHLDSVVIARPAAPKTLILLFHGVGSTAQDLAPLGQHIQASQSGAVVVSVGGTNRSSNGWGREWFSVAGISEESRPQRVRDAMPAFLNIIHDWQRETGIQPAATSLIGFSQGAIMALESTQTQTLAHRVISVSGRFAEPPRQPSRPVRFFFIHGEMDTVIAPSYSVESTQHLRSIGADAKLDLVQGLGHGIDARAAQLITDALL